LFLIKSFLESIEKSNPHGNEYEQYMEVTLDDIQDSPDSSKSLSDQLSSSSNSKESESNKIKPSFNFPKVKASAFTECTTEIHLFTGQVFKCDGFYSYASSYVWIALVGFILAVIFTMVVLAVYYHIDKSFISILKKTPNTTNTTRPRG
jgi:hypothetical protein